MQIEISRGAGMQECVYKYMLYWVRFPLEEIKDLIFSFLRSGVEAKRGDKFK